MTLSQSSEERVVSNKTKYKSKKLVLKYLLFVEFFLEMLMVVFFVFYIVVPITFSPPLLFAISSFILFVTQKIESCNLRGQFWLLKIWFERPVSRCP